MPLHPTWNDIALRLILTIVAGALIGFDREARGHAAGFRTTILVGLAACVAMIQANILLAAAGKLPDGFATMDVMRLPLGILTGVGFIGGGSVLRRGDLVLGVTTAATLWIITVIGLCFGGGQNALGVVATLLGFLVLRALQWLDRIMPREHRAMIAIAPRTPAAEPPDLNAVLGAGYHVRLMRQTRAPAAARPTFEYEVRWTARERAPLLHDLLQRVSTAYVLERFELVETH